MKKKMYLVSALDLLLRLMQVASSNQLTIITQVRVDISCPSKVSRVFQGKLGLCLGWKGQ